MRFIQVSLLFVFILTRAYSQGEIDYFVTANGNLYLPFNSAKGIFPILGYDKKSTPKLLIGGFGVGFSMWKMMRPKISIKSQANISRSVYWESFLFNDGPLSSDITGDASVSSADYTLGLIGIAHYHLSPGFSIGAGVGVQTMLASYSYMRNGAFPDGRRNLGRNRYYKTLMPTIPLEASFRFERWLVNIRYEQALLNRLKKDLAEYKKDRYGLLFFEIGYRINK